MLFNFTASAASSKVGRIFKRPIILDDDEGSSNDTSTEPQVIQSEPVITIEQPTTSHAITLSSPSSNTSITSTNQPDPASVSATSFSDSLFSIPEASQVSESPSFDFTSIPANPLPELPEDPTILHQVDLPGPFQSLGEHHSSQIATPVSASGSLAISNNSVPIIASAAVTASAATQVSDSSSSSSAPAEHVPPGDSYDGHSPITTSNLQSGSGLSHSPIVLSRAEASDSDASTSPNLASGMVPDVTLQPTSAVGGEQANETVLGKRKDS